jgi:hypothetical protein
MREGGWLVEAYERELEVLRRENESLKVERTLFASVFPT